MYNRFRLACKYLNYYITAANGKGHGIHSPFVFDLIINVLNDQRWFYAYNEVEQLRAQLLKDDTLLEVEDFGAGSALNSTRKRTVAQITRNTSKPEKLGRLLFRLVNYFQPQNIIELGTSMGISTAYLAKGRTDIPVWTAEGSTEIIRCARRNLDYLQLEKVRIVPGNFDHTLPGILEQVPQADFVFVDGNHRKAPTLAYFEQLMQKRHHNSVFIFDDIHWSAEMEEAWSAIVADPRVTLTVDLFFIGLVFFREEIKVKQDFIVRF